MCEVRGQQSPPWPQGGMQARDMIAIMVVHGLYYFLQNMKIEYKILGKNGFSAFHSLTSRLLWLELVASTAMQL